MNNDKNRFLRKFYCELFYYREISIVIYKKIYFVSSISKEVYQRQFFKRYCLKLLSKYSIKLSSRHTFAIKTTNIKPDHQIVLFLPLYDFTIDVTLALLQWMYNLQKITTIKRYFWKFQVSFLLLTEMTTAKDRKTYHKPTLARGTFC